MIKSAVVLLPQKRLQKSNYEVLIVLIVINRAVGFIIDSSNSRSQLH